MTLAASGAGASDSGAESNHPAARVPQFQAGDRWCAVGDSITHTGAYTRYICLFYTTRFPGRLIDYFNGGLAGDNAAATLKRANSDILRHKPTVVTIMLGMNDVRRNLYNEKASAPDIQKRRDAAIAGYETNMKQLAEALHAGGARLIFITPTIFDQTAVVPAPNLPGVNDALGRCGDYVKKLAGELNASVIDLHGPMSDLNHKQQEASPQFSLAGPDRIHPLEPGQFVMAYLFLKAQGAPQFVADIAVDAKGKKEVSFTLKEDALPFPVLEACLPALKLVPFMEELNQERLRVTNLPAGDYSLLIDDELIAAFSAKDLSAGINLAIHVNTPQYRQALAVAKLDEQRHDLVRLSLRTIDYVERMMGREIGDSTAFDYTPVAQKTIEKNGNPWVKARITDYLKIKPQQAELQKQLKSLVEEIRKASRPKPHRFDIRPVGETKATPSDGPALQ